MNKKNKKNKRKDLTKIKIRYRIRKKEEVQKNEKKKNSKQNKILQNNVFNLIIYQFFVNINGNVQNWFIIKNFRLHFYYILKNQKK